MVVISSTPQNGAYAALMSYHQNVANQQVYSGSISPTPIFEPESCYTGGQRPIAKRLPYRAHCCADARCTLAPK